jgi:hypothetical protein
VETGGGELESLQSRWYSTRPCRLLSGFLAIISISISFECWVKYVRRVCGKEKWSKYRKLKVKKDTVK